VGWPFEKSHLVGDEMRQAGGDLGCQCCISACRCRPARPGEERICGCLHLGIPVGGQ